MRWLLLFALTSATFAAVAQPLDVALDVEQTCTAGTAPLNPSDPVPPSAAFVRRFGHDGSLLARPPRAHFSKRKPIFAVPDSKKPRYISLGPEKSFIAKLAEYREKTKEMFYHAFTGYMRHAFPKDELKPISCSGEDNLGNFSLTLIDAMDTFAVMQDYPSFHDAIDLARYVTFSKDVNVSVFETNIRIVGGLLSSHLFAMNSPLAPVRYTEPFLLAKAVDLVGRLLPAFDTHTGLPYGSINLIKGVAKDESPVVCTACAGTFSIEFTWLSLLTGNPVYEQIARRAMRALWSNRSKHDLYGSHIHVDSGNWVYYDATIGGGSDSFYEYLIKSYVLAPTEHEYHEMFVPTYAAIRTHLRLRGMHPLTASPNPWHVDAHVQTAVPVRLEASHLGAFFASVKVLAGDVDEAVDDINAYVGLMKHAIFVPEAVDVGGGSLRWVKGKQGYFLRPEFVESLMYVYEATKDPGAIEVGFEMIERLQKWTRTECGFANVEDVSSMKLQDKMESFYLSETLKYLYLLFTPDHPILRTHIFSTEAHPFPITATHRTRFHLPETEAVMMDLFADQRTPPAPPNGEDGDPTGPVRSGFREGVCWARSWEAARQKKIEGWRLSVPHAA
ncbi:ER degradation-enhancing alpha-mannosidase-like 2 precursor [Cladochytrium replicatum]|nr:ER degradation-enhancing alpha-mannosidase-like 2 precursor [Cladochytrium replicatum]